MRVFVVLVLEARPLLFSWEPSFVFLNLKRVTIRLRFTPSRDTVIVVRRVPSHCHVIEPPHPTPPINAALRTNVSVHEHYINIAVRCASRVT